VTKYCRSVLPAGLEKKKDKKKRSPRDRMLGGDLDRRAASCSSLQPDRGYGVRFSQRNKSGEQKGGK